MKVLVCDTSVLLDLERGALVECCFRLPFELAMPDLLYCRELEPHGGPDLVKLGLRIEALTSQELSSVQTLWGEQPKLSLPDAYAYTLASTRQWTLLCGDGELRTLALARQVDCFGVLWLCDQLFDGRTIETSLLVASLEAIVTHPRCRLPRAEIAARMTRYRR